jgi:hypothetical protein
MQILFVPGSVINKYSDENNIEHYSHVGRQDFAFPCFSRGLTRKVLMSLFWEGIFPVAILWQGVATCYRARHL